MLYTYTLQTQNDHFHNITHQVRAALNESRVKDGLCVVFCPHTTAAITINENADPDVIRDLTLALAILSPDRPEYRHMEGNSKAHLKASLLGASETILIEDGKLVLGTWQGLYFCEFDGPRNRKFHVKFLREN